MRLLKTFVAFGTLSKVSSANESRRLMLEVPDMDAYDDLLEFEKTLVADHVTNI